jgi:hypothetical protein
MAAATVVDEAIEANPLMRDFDFPPFDVVEAKHVRPGIRALLKNLVCCVLFIYLFIFMLRVFWVFYFGDHFVVFFFWVLVLCVPFGFMVLSCYVCMVGGLRFIFFGRLVTKIFQFCLFGWFFRTFLRFGFWVFGALFVGWVFNQFVVFWWPGIEFCLVLIMGFVGW